MASVAPAGQRSRDGCHCGRRSWWSGKEHLNKVGVLADRRGGWWTCGTREEELGGESGRGESPYQFPAGSEAGDAGGGAPLEPEERG